MNRISFKGYAQQGKFDPIKLPDQTAKIAQEGERTLRGMRAVRDQDKRNRDAYESVLRQKNADESRNRQQNFDFDTQMRKNYRDAVNQNYQTEIANTRKESEQKAETWKAISSLSKTASDYYGKYKDKKDQEDEIAGMNAVYASGITVDEWRTLNRGEAEINATDASVNDMIQSMQARGVSPSQIDSLRNLSGKRLYGARKAMAQKGGQEYGIFLAQSAEQEVVINGQPTTLARAQADGNVKAIPQILNQLRTSYISKFAGMDPAFANEYLFKGMRATEASYNAKLANEITAQTSAKLAAEDNARVKSDWDTSGAQGFYDNLTLNGGDRGQNRAKGLKALSLMAQAGSFDANDLDALKSLPIPIPGSNKMSTFGDFYGTELIGLQSAVDQKISQDRTKANSDEREAKDNFVEHILTNRPPAGYTEEQHKDWESKWIEQFGDTPPPSIQAMDSQEEIADEQAEEEFLGILSSGGTLTQRHLTNGRASAKVWEKFQRYVKDDSTSKATQLEIKALLSVPREMLQESQAVNASSAALQMQAILTRDLSNKVQMIMSAGNKDINQAYAEAIPQIQVELEKGANSIEGKPGTGRYAMSGGLGIDAEFKILSDVKTDNTRQIIQDFKEKVAEDASVVLENVVLPEPALDVLQQSYKKGTLPSWAWKAAELIKMDPFEFAESQLSLAGKMDKPVRPAEAEVYGYTDAEFQRLLKSAPSGAKTARAMSLTSQRAGESPYTPILNLIASKESRSTDPENDGYDAMNTGGANGGHTAFGSGTGNAAFGQKLTQMSVAEVMRLQSKGALHASGRYQIIGSTLKGLVDKGVMSPDELYSPEVQDRAAIELFHGRVGKFIDANGEEVVGLGQEWIGLQNLPRDVILQSLRNTAANLDNPNFNPDMMRNEIVYRVGNIGPTSTGAHLDVKQVGLDFFGRKTLDSYIGYKTAEGFQPLSAGVTVNGGEFGASRNYGEHRGWDYAMPAGTPVVLKGGARIVGVEKNTGHGDRLTIGLPDGRQFEILHGKA